MSWTFPSYFIPSNPRRLFQPNLSTAPLDPDPVSQLNHAHKFRKMSAAETASPAPWPPATNPASAPTTASRPADATSSSEGPLRSLAQKAASTNLVRRARQGVPSFAEPAVSRTANTAEVVLTHVDGGLNAAQNTLSTDEGKALCTAAVQFWTALCVFVAMLAMAALEQAERILDIKYDAQDQETPKAHTRTLEVLKVAGNKMRTKFERREREVQGTGEAEIYKKVKFLGGTILAVLTCTISSLTKYSGPAREYIVPVAERAISMLPKDISDHVDETAGGATAVRAGADTNNAPEVKPVTS